jgi:citrate lyase beta subunit
MFSVAIAVSYIRPDIGDDLCAVVRREVTGIILPKCHDSSQIVQVHQDLSRLENQSACLRAA